MPEIKLELPGESQGIKVRETGGNIHFCDEKAQVKVSIPAVEWWSQWQRLKMPPRSWTYVDTINSSYLSINSFIDLGVSPPKAEVTVVLNKIEVGVNFTRIHDFTKGTVK